MIDHAAHVILVDDHKIMRDGIKAILGRGEEFRVVGEAENGTEAAVMLDLREPTVRSRRKTMMKKLGVNNAVGLTHLALSIGLTQLPRGQVAEHERK